jgi:hypothetical protein
MHREFELMVAFWPSIHRKAMWKPELPVRECAAARHDEKAA